MTQSVKCFSSKWKIAFACSTTLKNKLSGGVLGSAGGNAIKQTKKTLLKILSKVLSYRGVLEIPRNTKNLKEKYQIFIL